MYPDKNSVKTEAGLSVTTRRVVAPRPGLVGPESGEFEKKVWMPKAVCALFLKTVNRKQELTQKNGQPKSGKVRLKHPEGFEIQTLQPISL